MVKNPINVPATDLDIRGQVVLDLPEHPSYLVLCGVDGTVIPNTVASGVDAKRKGTTVLATEGGVCLRRRGAG